VRNAKILLKKRFSFEVHEYVLEYKMSIFVYRNCLWSEEIVKINPFVYEDRISVILSKCFITL
jgi:hypothetical protein